MGLPIESKNRASEPIRLQAARWQIFFGAIGWAVIIGFHVLGAYIAITNPDGSFNNPIGAALIAIALAYVYWALFAWFLVGALHDRISIFDDAIVHETTFSKRCIELRDVLSVDWRQHTIRVVVHGPSTRIAIWLNGYPLARQLEVIEHLRTSVPRHRHKNYRKFRLAYHKLRRQPRKPSPQETRQHALLCALVVVLAFIGIAAENQDVTGYVSCCVAAACVTGVIVYVFRYGKPRKLGLGVG